MKTRWGCEILVLEIDEKGTHSECGGFHGGSEVALCARGGFRVGFGVDPCEKEMRWHWQLANHEGLSQA